MNASFEMEDREKIISAAVEVVSEKGIWATSMGEIGRRADVDPKTLRLSYTAPKEIFGDYYQLIQEKVIQDLNQIEEFDQYTLQEKLQVFLESQLDYYLEDRSFIQKTYLRVFINPVSLFTGALGRKQFNQVIKYFLETSINNQEIPDPILGPLIPDLLGAYFLFILAYWTKDKSENFVNTTQIIDLSLEIITTTLQSGFPEKVRGLLTLLLRLHVLNRFEDVSKVFERFQKKNNPPTDF